MVGKRLKSSGSLEFDFAPCSRSSDKDWEMPSVKFFDEEGATTAVIGPCGKATPIALPQREKE